MKQTAEWLMDERSRVEPHLDLVTAKVASSPYLHTLPRELQTTLESDPPNPTHTAFDEGDGLWGMASSLQEYLEKTEPKGARRG
jgi:hypothetical protein